MGNEYLVYLQEISDMSWVVELISEQFDDAINMMTANSIIYGGAVRDCLAGKTLLGDLDIIVSSAEHHVLVNRFIKSPKWVLINRTQKRDINSVQVTAKYKPFNPFLPANNNHLYKNSKISGITSFKTLGDKVVQIVELPTTNNTPFQSAIHFVKQVDIICCGVILTSNGKVFEVVPSAYDDCKKGILRLNSLLNINDLEKFQSRIKKLVTRGWYNTINMNQAIKNIKKKQKICNQPDKTITATTDIHTVRFNYAKSKAATIIEGVGHKTFISNATISSIGGKTKLFSLLDRLAKTYLLDIIIQVKFNGIMMKTINRSINHFVYKKIFGVKERLIQKFPSDKRTYIKWKIGNGNVNNLF